jgi:type I restriction-modification system DNA methylase subunit
MDYKKLNEDELIQLCKDKGIDYYNPKTKKNYAKPTLISRLTKTEVIVSSSEDGNEEVVNIEYKNEIIWTLSNEDKKNNDEYKEIESKLLNCIKSCHDYLRSNGAITGIKASNDIIRIIIFRLFNIIYKNDEFKQEIRNKISSEILEKYEKYLIDIKEFNKSTNIDNDIKLFIMKIFIIILPNVFNSDDIIFNMRNYPKNYTTIINKIAELIDIDNYDKFIKLFADTGGNIYEYFTNSYGKGNSSKELGQFFTPFKLINLILFNIKDYITIDDTYSIYDPCCGSGGLLNRTSSYLGINKNNIYGCEIEKDTIKYALASLIVNNNNSLKINILNNCSLSNNNYIFENKKFNLILTNPPFGIKMTYKDLKSKFEEYRDGNYKTSPIIKFEDVYPINTNNGPSLFLQHVIYVLQNNGICGIVLPDGSELSHNSYYNIRKYLIDNCKILKVINVSSGAFNSTGVKTKILIFKKQKGKDNHKNIEFLEINKDCNEVKLVAIADLDKNYSFKLKINQEIDNNDKYKECEIKTLGELCKFLPKSKRNAKYGNKEGLYPFFKSSIIVNSYVNEPDYDEESLIIGDGGDANINYSIKFSASDHCYILQNKNKLLLNLKYAYYYLYYNLNIFKELFTGVAIKNISKTNIEQIRIPIPPIEIQNKKVEEIDKLEQSIEAMKTRISQIKYEQEYILSIKLKECINIIYKSVGEMFDLIKGSLQSSKIIENEYGLYPIISIAEKNKFTNNINEINLINGENIFIATTSSGTSCGPFETKIKYFNGVCSYTNLLSNFKVKNNYQKIIIIKYIYYYLSYKKNYIEETYEKGLANKSLNVEEFNLMKIPIPPIEIQNEIVKILDDMNDRMNYDIKHIELLQSIIKDIINY